MILALAKSLRVLIVLFKVEAVAFTKLTVAELAAVTVEYARPIRGNIAEEVVKLEKLHPDKIIWVVGGAEILEECRALYDRIYLTHFKGNFRIDTKVNLKSLLSACRFKYASADPKDNCTFVEYEPLFKRPARST